MKKSIKKSVGVLALALAVAGGTTAYAASYGNSKNGASNTEVLQVKYDGAAWNYSGSGYSWASFTYTRNGKTLLKKYAYNGKVTGSVWDDLLDWSESATTHFYWNHG